MTASTPTPETTLDLVPSKENPNVRQDNPLGATEGGSGIVDHLRAWREAGGVAAPPRNPIEKG